MKNNKNESLMNFKKLIFKQTANGQLKAYPTVSTVNTVTASSCNLYNNQAEYFCVGITQESVISLCFPFFLYCEFFFFLKRRNGHYCEQKCIRVEHESETTPSNKNQALNPSLDLLIIIL